MKNLHERMPCLLSQETANIWVNRKLSPDERIAALDPINDNLLEMKAVHKVGDMDEYKSLF